MPAFGALSPFAALQRFRQVCEDFCRTGDGAAMPLRDPKPVLRSERPLQCTNC
jgi:hypothetical protein